MQGYTLRRENSKYKIQNSKLLILALLVVMVLPGCSGGPTPTREPPQPTATEAEGAASPSAAVGQPTAAEQPTSVEQPTAMATEGETPTAATGGGTGGVLRWSNEGVSELDTLDPPKTQASNSVMAWGLIFEGLVRLDTKLNVRPTGAEKWDISDDGKTYTFTIRKGLKWADGSDVTSEDFRYSLERALSKDFANGSAGYYLSNNEGADRWIKGEGPGLTGGTAPSPDKLVIKIVKPGVYFLDQLT